MPAIRRATLLLFCALLSAAARQSEYSLRVDSNLVLIPVTVTDSSNRFVLGLEKDNFLVKEDGVEQTISQFAGEEAPLSIGLLVDTSGSMAARLDISRRAVAEFMKTMNAQDEAFLIEFADEARLVCGFTNKSSEIDEKVATLETQGLTALLDAVHIGLDEMKKAKNPRKALLIISDGGDNNSKFTEAQIKDLVREAGVQVYAMGVFAPFSALHLGSAELSGPALLTELSEQTGGRSYPARSFSALPSVARNIGVELRNQYLLAYMPVNHDKDGKFRKVEVSVNPPAGLSALKARWRQGYYAPR